MYCTNQKEIVEHARICYKEYPSIVNNIPKDSNVYDNSMDDFARLDNKLAASQLAIGESSNLAQLAQTYDCTFGDEKYKSYVCILSVIAQIAIDSSKRMFDIDVNNEIRRIKKDMNVKEHKYPKFWQIINKDFNRKNINNSLHCPMNYLYDLKLDQFRNTTSTIDMSELFIKHPVNKDRRRSKKVEELIGKYSDALLNYNMLSQNESFEENRNKYLILRQDFNMLVNDIRNVNISSNYKGLMSWLIDRCFMITNDVQKNNVTIKKNIRKNRVAMMKVLYTVNRKNFLSCFKKSAI